jgi:hypothetical protein
LNLKTLVVTLGIFFSTTASADYTAIASGSWSSAATWGGAAPTATVLNQNITIPSGISVTLDANITLTGLLKSFIVNGVLTNTTSFGIVISQGDLAGNGSISVNKINFMLLGTGSFSGNMNVKHLINSTASLAFGAIANVSDTLNLENGIVLLNTNSNLTMLSNSTVKVNSGSLVLSAGLFNSTNAYNVMYTGVSKISGIEFNTATMHNAYVYLSSATESLTLNANTVINGTLNIASGKLFLNGKSLTLKDNLAIGTLGKITSNATSSLMIEGTGTLTSALMFDAGSSLGDFSINRATVGQVKMASALIIANHLNLMDGSFSVENGGMLTMNSASTVHVEKGNLALNTGTFVGTAAYSVEYMGAANGNAGAELTGSGLNNIVVDYLANTNKVVLSNSTTVAGNLNMNKGQLDLNGKKLILNGTISQNVNAKFIGNAVSELHLNLNAVTNDTIFFDNSTVNNQSLSVLKINTSGTTAIVMGTKLILNNELTFVKGKIELASGDLVMASTASITGYDDTKYIMTSENAAGSLVMNVTAGSSFLTFPVGTLSNYSPAYIQQNSSATSGNFNVKTMNNVLSSGTFGAINSANLKVVNRTWFVESTVATINANIKFGWVVAAEVNGFSRNNAYVSHYTTSIWDIVAASSATAGAYNTFELSRTGITSLSPFAVTETGQALKIKELVLSAGFEMYPNPSKDIITIKFSTPTDNFKYELFDISGRTVLSGASTHSNKLDVSTLENGCYFMRVYNSNDNSIVTKRFVKE